MSLPGSIFGKYKALPVQLRASLWFLICGILQRGIAVIVTPIFARLLSTAEYGEYSNFTSWQELLGIILTLRLYAGVFMQGLVRYDDNKDQYTSALIGLTTLLEITGMVIYLSNTSLWNSLTGMSTKMTLCVFAVTWAHALFGFWQTRQRIVYRYRALVALTLTMSVLQPLAGVTAVLVFPEDKVGARVVSMAIVQLLCFGWLSIMYLKRGKRLYVRRHWVRALKFNLPLVPHYLSQTALASSDRIMIRNLASASAAGIYGLSYSISFIMTIVNQSLLNTLNPWIYQQIKAGRIRDLARVSYLAVGTVATANLFVVALAPEVITFFAPEAYHEGMWLVPPLAGSVVVTFMYALFADFEFYYERTNLVMLASLVGAFLNIGLNWIFIPIFGYQVAAWTTLVGYMVYVSMHYFFMRKVQHEEMDGVRVYDPKVLIGILAGFGIIAGILTVLYPFPIVRYVFCIAILVAVWMKRSTLLSLWKQLREGGKKRKK